MLEDRSPTSSDLEELNMQLQEAEETLRAIRHGEVDALVVTEGHGERVYTLKSADRPYRMMIECMRQGAVTLTPDGMVLYCNSSFAELVKAPLGSIIGSAVHRFVSEPSADFFAALLRQEGGGKGEVVLRSEDGTPLPAYAAFSALPEDEPGEPLLCLVVTDLTEQKRNEQLVADERLARSAAEAMNQAKDHFLAMLSHELRTPLTPVLAVISGLDRSDHLPPALRQDLAMMRRNIELEARIIDDLLDLTRVSSGKIQLERRSVDLREILAHAVQTSCGEALSTGSPRVDLDLADADHRLWGDASRLTQVFWNLLNNAVKFTPQEGTITVRSRREASRLTVEIADTGVGIEPKVLPRIFDAFEQGGDGVMHRYGGLGLGLAIGKAIVDLHGGEIVARSEGRGRGTMFTVHLPIGVPTGLPVFSEEAKEVSEPAPAEESANGAAPRRLRILLVEDHTDTAEAIAELLRIGGHAVTVAATSTEARAAAERAGTGGFDLVVSDLGLPDGSGQDLMRELSRRYGLHGIALSGYGMEADIRRSREAGFERHLTKPVNLETLESAIQQVAGQESARS
jgi:signal transduction histidine kinase/ActR/RegA family two-component response regulator